jgi:uncharacterized surface protein with fasciclin (FAS1) repeats
MIKTMFRTALAATALSLVAPAAFANPMVGGAAMYPTKTIVDNAVNSKDHTTLVAAVKAADLVGTLSSPGPFTVFAPTNAAFAKLPAGTMTSQSIAAAIKAGGGKAELTTVQGEKLTAWMKGDKLVLTDAKGGNSMVTIADVMQSNGVIHVVDTVLMP